MPTSVFISYSHDSPEHKDLVRSLADTLRDKGLDCQIDQYINGFPAEGWQRWMETQIEESDFVLIACTETYLKRFRGLDDEGGRGVNFEGVVISQTLYDNYYRNTKFIPVIPEHGSMDDVPLPLKVYSTYTLMRDFTELYRVLTDQHATPAPSVGKVEKLSVENIVHADRTTTHTLKPNEDKTMSNTMKAAYLGVGATLLAAIIAGLFSLFGTPNNIASGNCSSVITGSVGGNISVNCPQKGEE